MITALRRFCLFKICLERILLLSIFLTFFSCSSDKTSNDEQDSNVLIVDNDIDWNEFIEYSKGNIPVILISVHGGTLSPEWISDRSCPGAVTVKDDNTLELAKETQEALSLIEASPYVVLNKISRKKIDLNRSLEDSNCGDRSTEEYWDLFHKKVLEYTQEIEALFGKGLVLDLHGHGHAIQRIELGYLLSKSRLSENDESLNSDDITSLSSIKSLAANNLSGINHSELLRGEKSFGSLLDNEGYPAVPSKNDTHPNSGELYFTGGYNTFTYGSRNKGNIDAIQLEINKKGVREDLNQVENFASALSNVIMEYLSEHYGDYN